MNPNWYARTPVVVPSLGYPPVQDFVPEGAEYPDPFVSEGQALGYQSQLPGLDDEAIFHEFCNVDALGEPADEPAATTQGSVIDPALLTEDPLLKQLSEADWTVPTLQIKWHGNPEVQATQPNSARVHVETTVDVKSTTTIITHSDGVARTAKEETYTPALAAAAPAQSPSTSDSVKSESVQTEDQVHINPSELTMQDIEWMVDSGVGSNTLFQSVEEARQSFIQEVNQEEDPTLPTTEEQKRVLVVLLVAALNSTNTQPPIDSDKTIARFANNTYKPERIEAMCWEVLEKLILRHTTGRPLTEGHKKTETGRFLDRFLAVRKVLEASKSICKHAMDPEFIDTLIDDPDASLKRVISNKKVNENKSKIIEAGTKVIAETKAAGGQQALNQAQAGHLDGSTPNPQLATPVATTSAGKKRARKADAKGTGSSKKARR